MYCPSCLPGYHLPYLGAAANGLFASHGFEVEISEPVGGPENVVRVAEGALDFCLTSVSHFLRAGRDARGARFAAMIVQRSPMAGIVRSDSDLKSPEDLAPRRLGGSQENGLVIEYQAAMAALGLTVSALVPLDYADAPAALGRGDIDVVPDFVDLLPRTRRQAGVPVRAISVGAQVYANGLVAADRLPKDLVKRFRAAIVGALELQRADPRWALGALHDRYPDVDPGEALEGWGLAAGNIFCGEDTGRMEASRWQATLDHVSAAHTMKAPAANAVYRSEFLAVPTERSLSSSPAA